MVLSLTSVYAKAYTVESLPVVTKGDDKFVCNPDGILSADVVSSINGLCKKLEDSTSIQILVVAVDDISPEDDFTFALQVGRQYGVGVKKYNSGLVILLARNMRAVRMVTGKGLEGDLPDVICRRIQSQRMVPYLKDNRWNEGMLAGVQAVYNQLIGTESFAPMGDDEEGEGMTTFDYIVIFLIFVLPFLLIAYEVWRSGRCPYCKKKMQFIDSQSYRQGFKETILKNYLCNNCGRRTTIKSLVDHSPSVSRGFSGSGGGSSSRGGGGHSFGGGTFSGGGAGSRF